MFERYTEKARRVIFFARYEASQFGAPAIEPEHLLLGLMREDKTLTLEDAIRKFSALSAQKMRLADRGVLKQGMWADIVVFDPETIRDVATFDNPNQLSDGMRFVLVNGVPVIEEGKMTNALPGKVILGPAAR